MKYIVAVSGGVDSVVLLDMLVKSGKHDLVVAHFDHGIRPESAADAEFVRGLAGLYGLPFYLGEGKLGSVASEERARVKRYEFLKGLAEQQQAKLVTAHHADDLIESIAINITRGTGWRGLAVLNDPTIDRPLLEQSKQQLYTYAVAQKLEWVEDETNQTDRYLRNRLRRKLNRISIESKLALQLLRSNQCRLAAAIDEECGRIAANSRYFFTMVDEGCALEVLRYALSEQSASLTRPQRRRLLHAIKTAAPGTTFEAGSGVNVYFTLRDFIVKQPL